MNYAQRKRIRKFGPWKQPFEFAMGTFFLVGNVIAQRMREPNVVKRKISDEKRKHEGKNNGCCPLSFAERSSPVQYDECEDKANEQR
jgi:hypothetical protein